MESIFQREDGLAIQANNPKTKKLISYYMKIKIFLRVSLLVAAVFVLGNCTKSDIELAREEYDASKVVPVVQGINGSAVVLQTKTYKYEVSYYRAGSTWNWSGQNCVVQSVSEDTHSAIVLFDAIPSDSKAKVIVTETTIGGVTSPAKEFVATVNPFCPLAITGFVGTWSGTDGYGDYMYDSQVVTSDASGTSIKAYGLNFGWIADYWAEEVTAGGTVNLTINDDGTVTVADQYCFTTLYDGDPYEYWIKGSGTWSNCGTHPEMKLYYNIYYKSDGYTLPSNADKTRKFTADLVLDGGATKGAVSPKYSPISPELKRR
jgi:hypothetical protein